MKVLHRIIAVLSLPACACTQAKPKDGSSPPSKKASGSNLSHQYKRDAVASFEAYEIATPGHSLVLFTLKNGTRIPMLCKREAENIHPIPQSVFKQKTDDEWGLIAEPLITAGDRSIYAMVMMNCKLSGGSLFSDNKALVKSSDKLVLVDRPKKPKS